MGGTSPAADPAGAAGASAPAAGTGPPATIVRADAPRDGSTSTRLLLACGIAGPVLFWALGAAAAASWPGYDPVSGSISSLVLAPEGWLQVDAFILLAVLTMAFAVGMGRIAGATTADRGHVRGAILALAAIELGFALFPTDPGEGLSTMATAHGTLHMVVFAAFAIGFPILGFGIGSILRADPPWWRAGILTTIVSGAMALAIVAVVLVVAGPLGPWTGLLERMYVAIPSLWLAGLAVHGLLVSAGRIRGRAPAPAATR